MRNEYRIKGNDVYITIRKDPHTETIISLEDLPLLLDRNCKVHLLGKYAVIDFLPWSLRHRVRLHRFIMDAPDHLQVDHINRNPLDNRRSNLRLATSAQNSQNRSLRSDSTSGHTGVYKNGDRWVVHIRVDGKNCYFGIYDTIEEASNIASKYRAVYHPYSLEAITIENPDVPDQRVAVNNKSGITGINWNNLEQKWKVALSKDKKRFNGGSYSNLEDAKIALEKLKQEIGYNVAPHRILP